MKVGVITIVVLAFCSGVLGGLVYAWFDDSMSRRRAREALGVLAELEAEMRDPSREPRALSMHDDPRTYLRERSRYGQCLGCGAMQDEWCHPTCSYLDRWDHRQ